MSLSLYISNTELQILETAGRGARIERALHFPIPEGSMMNGVITDEASLGDFLQDIWEKYALPTRNVELVIDSGKIMTRLLELPPMKPQEICGVAEREFAGNEREAHLVDYIISGEKNAEGKDRVLAVAVEKSLVESYLSLCQGAGLSLRVIHVGLAGIISALTASGIFREKTGFVLVIEDMTVVSLLFEQGVYQYSRRTRLFSAEGSPQRRDELAQLLSTLQQFYIGRRSANPLDVVYFTPLAKEDGEELREAGRRFGLTVEELDRLPNVEFARDAAEEADFRSRPGYYLVPLGGILMSAGSRGALGGAKPHRMNFYRRYYFTPERLAKQRKWRRNAILCGLLALVLLGTEGVFLFRRQKLEKEVAALAAYTEDTENAASYARAQEVDEKLAALGRQQADREQALNAIATYPLVGGSVFRQVENCASGKAAITIQGYDAETGKLTFYAVADEVSAASELIDRLKGLGLFRQVTYSGYEYSASQKGYVVNVECLLSGDAGK